MREPGRGRMMNNENNLIEKSLYKTLLTNDNAANPLLIISEEFLAEQQKELPELSTLRFAQGELYFHYKDYETSIFKWEKVSNDLAPWAIKNMADAYFAMAMYKNAEELYKSIESDSIILNTEVGLQLFALYTKLDKTELADKTIKKVVKLNPDDSQVTEIARSFFEEQRDWNSAVELAVNESIRTESLLWYDVLQSYIDQGVTKNMEPGYFYQVLHKLYSIDSGQFEQLAVSLWNSYKGEPAYLQWVQGFNDLLQDLELVHPEPWSDLSFLFKEGYFELINGHKLLKTLKGLLPSLLRNWIRITDRKHALLASSAILAWNDNFPGMIGQIDIDHAERVLMQAENNRNGLEDSVRLFEEIDQWANQNNLSVSERQKWIIDELLDVNVQHIMIAGTSGSGKSALIHSILGEELFDKPTSSAIMFKNAEEESIMEVTDSSINPLNLEELEDKVSNRNFVDNKPSIIEYHLPSQFLAENQIAIIDTPGFSIANNKIQEVRRYLNMADGLLLVLDVNDPFTNKEREIVMALHEQVPDLPIHFLLNKMDLVHNDQEAIRIVDEAWSRISPYLPNATIFAHSAHYRSNRQLSDFAEFIKMNLTSKYKESARTAKLLHFVRETISSLLDQRLEREESLIESIHWNEDLLAKLNGAKNQMEDLEKEKAVLLRKTFKQRKEAIRLDVEAAVPKILRASKDLITEDSDFRKIHIDLNEKMNVRIQEYLENTILPKYFYSLKDWITEAEVELKESQAYLKEMAEGFNAIYQEERMKMECDFRVLDDWRRDANRMTSGVQMETINILLRHTPQQLLLKSAGMLFGSIANKSVMYNKYTTLIETQDYTEVAQLIADKFLLQFDMFEKSITRDVSMFFADPTEVMNGAMSDTNEKIAEHNGVLEKMRSQPELYRDPLKLYELRLRQYEWILIGQKEVQTISR